VRRLGREEAFVPTTLVNRIASTTWAFGERLRQGALAAEAAL
jgi:hypothetical protein